MRSLDETRGVQFELVRHFLRRMFEGEWSSAPGQWRSAAVGLVSLLLPAGVLLLREGATRPAYAFKYRLVEASAGAAGLSAAVLADRLALLLLLMCVAGIVAVLQWQSLFPSGRDYLALASLPVRPVQVFKARFASVTLFSAVIVFAIVFVPSLVAPLEFGGGASGWGQMGFRRASEYWSRVAAQWLASASACAFVFASVVAVQGLLLNVVPPRRVPRVSAAVQGCLAGAFLLGGLYSWSIKDWDAGTVARLSELRAWPPVWFLGLWEVLSGADRPWFGAVAGRALLGLAGVLLLAAATYGGAYRRYRILLLEAPVAGGNPWRWSERLIGAIAGGPRAEAVIAFMLKTLLRSAAHRVLLLVYLGATAAVLINSSLIDGGILRNSGGLARGLQFAIYFWPLACSLLVLAGLRHIMSIPAELRANWLFRISEAEGRREWMSAVERFVIAFAIAPIYLIVFPVGGVVLGWPLAARLAALQLLASLAMFEGLFGSWQKLPFACAHAPAQQSLIAVVGKYLGMLGVLVPVLSVVIGVASQAVFLYPLVAVLLVACWRWLRRQRRELWGDARLIYDDAPSVVADLGIKDIRPFGLGIPHPKATSHYQSGSSSGLQTIR